MLGVAAVVAVPLDVHRLVAGRRARRARGARRQHGAGHARRRRRRARLAAHAVLAGLGRPLPRPDPLARHAARRRSCRASTSSCCSARRGRTSPPGTSRADPALPRSRKSWGSRKVGDQGRRAGRRSARAFRGLGWRVASGARADGARDDARHQRVVGQPASARPGRPGRPLCSCDVDRALAAARSSAASRRRPGPSTGSPSVGPGTAPGGRPRSRSLSGASCWQAVGHGPAPAPTASCATSVPWCGEPRVTMRRACAAPPNRRRPEPGDDAAGRVPDDVDRRRARRRSTRRTVLASARAWAVRSPVPSPTAPTTRTSRPVAARSCRGQPLQRGRAAAVPGQQQHRARAAGELGRGAAAAGGRGRPLVAARTATPPSTSATRTTARAGPRDGGAGSRRPFTHVCGSESGAGLHDP